MTPTAEVVHRPFVLFTEMAVDAFVTTRAGGVSRPPFDSLNLAYLTADRREDVRVNRELVAAALGISHDELLIGRQVHGGQINRAEDIELGVTTGDGILLSRAGTAAMIVAADCVPLLLYHPDVHAGVVVHAGWRGLAAGVIPNAVSALADQGADPAGILVGLGPAIGPCCYEVGPEVIAALEPRPDEHGSGRADRSFLDLKAIARRQLSEAGIRAESIEDLEICTRCRHDIYFSARAGEPTGRFAAGLKLL